jgi:alginate O-acetyltransferase complex protein AlgI
VRFNSYEFFIFFAVVLALSPLLKARARHMMLLAGSYIFYATWNPPFVLLLLFSTVLDFTCGARIHATEDKRKRLAWLWTSLVGNLGVLAYFKYGNFFLDNVAFVSGIDPEPFYLDVVIPLGISFYTFQSMSYTLDIYRRSVDPCKRFLDFALYVTFFPQLIAGPILRINEFLPQLERKDPVRQEEILRGTELFLLGLFKKVVIADNIAVISDIVFANPGEYNGLANLIAAVAFWIQVYCDFSGYSTMARGIASLLGFRLPRNFLYPQFQYNPPGFRRTWHMTMATWFSDYVYRPLGGGRVSDGRFFFNVMLTWTLLGFWHGASWNFILWGAWNGAILAVYSVVLRRKKWALPDFTGKRFLGWLINIILGVPSCILFRAQSASDGWAMCKSIFLWESGGTVDVNWGWAILGLIAIHALSYWIEGGSPCEKMTMCALGDDDCGVSRALP